MSTQTLYERIGGDSAIERLLANFYHRVYADPELSPFFRHADLGKLIRMQRLFFTVALGGPDEYTGRPIATVHAGMGVRRRHFARFVEHMIETLDDIGVGEENAAEIITRINTFADDIVGGHGLDG